MATNPESGAVTYGYDNNGNLITKLDARSITTTFAYDALNRPTSKSYNDTPQTPRTDYYYDNAPMPAGAPTFTRGSSTGRLVAVTYGTSSSAGTYRGYDELGEVVRQYQRTDSVNYLVDATYNKAGAVATEVYPTVPGAGDRRTVSYTPDAAGRLGSLSTLATTYAPAASVSSVGYSSHNALATETYGNSLIHAQVYNNRLQPTAIKLGTAALPTSVLNLTYSYGTTNNNGNVQSLTYAGGGLSYTQTFGYDQLNRLTTSQEGASWSQTNSYDRYGNRAIVGGGLTFNAANNRITTVGYAYDAVGNLTSDNLHGYNFDAENKLSKVDAVSAYTYDGEGQRVRKLVNENLRFIYDMSGREIAEFDGTTGNLKKEYIYGAGGLTATIEPTAVNANGTRYTTSDTLGSPRVVTNSSAVVISRHDYKPFGEQIGLVGGRTTGMGYSVADGVRQKFTSKERDNETGLDYFGARYYSSTQGRFTGVDPGPFTVADPQSWNRYLYVQNNPLKFIDPTGRKLELSGDKAQELIDYLKKKTGLDLKYDSKTGRVTVGRGKRVEEGTSKELTDVVKKVISAGEKVALTVTENQPSSNFVDDYTVRTADLADIKAIDSQAPNLASALVGHFLNEYLDLAKGLSFDDTTYTYNKRVDKGAHSRALEVESKIMSGYTGVKEKTRATIDNNPTFSFVYTSVQYDVEVKSGAKGTTDVNKVTTKKLP